jgi:hypothetical protein
MLANLAVTEDATYLDVVDHDVAGPTEQVGRHPMGSTRVLIGTDVLETQGEILGPGGQQALHVTGIETIKRLVEPGGQCG